MPPQPAPVHETLGIALYRVEHSPYNSLELTDAVFGHWILSYVVAGELRTASCGYEWDVRAGDVMLHPPHVPFDEVASGSGVHQWIMFDAVASGFAWFQLHAVAPVTRLRDPGSYRQVFGRLEHVWRAPASAERNLLAAALAAQVLGMVVADWRASGAPARPDAFSAPRDRFGEVVAYMTANLERRVSRDELAARVHMHPASFDRAFRAIHGVTPKQLLRELRLRRARELLETTELPLEAVAARSGFSDAAHLSRVWRASWGTPPGEYRERLKRTMSGYISPLPRAPE